MGKQCSAKYFNDFYHLKVMIGSRGDDILEGNDDNDIFIGRLGDEYLNEYAGNALLLGSMGKDKQSISLKTTEKGALSKGQDIVLGPDKGNAFDFDADNWRYQERDNAVKKFADNGNHDINQFADGDLIILQPVGNAWLVSEYRNIDGFANNPYSLELGSTHQQMLRVGDSDYGDGLNTPSGSDRPSARVVSNEIFQQDAPITNSLDANDLFWLWGQFIDHDIDLTPTGDEAFNIEVPVGDPWFDPDGNGGVIIPLTRSKVAPGTGENGIPREQINEITSYIDASNVYGSDQLRADMLRGDNGLLKTSSGDLLPFNLYGLPNAPYPGPEYFLAGDVRANENVGLTSLHTLFMREHNRLAENIAQEHPEYSSDEIYQEAKMMVEAYMQNITFNEFLPLLLGDDAIPEYQGYDVDVDPQIDNMFAAAAFRLGHTLLSNELELVNEDGTDDSQGPLSLKDAFFNPAIFGTDVSIEDLIRGVAANFAEEVDTQIVDDVRNFLFGEPGQGGLDLAALNIQRGRDHGLPDYNSAREIYGLDKVDSFDDITSDPALQQALETVYGDVDSIDVFVGGLAEDHYKGMLGELFHTIVSDQFIRIRDGDRLWFENDRFTDEQLIDIQNTSLADILLRNSDIEYIQQNIFVVYQRLGGTDQNDVLIGSSGHNLILGFDGNDKLYGKQSDDEIYGGEGNDILKGNKGNDLLDGEVGNDTYIGGKGNDYLVFGLNNGHDKVKGYQPDKDIIDLQAYQTSFHDLDIDYNGHDTIINLAGNNTIELEGISPFDLNEDGFIF